MFTEDQAMFSGGRSEESKTGLGRAEQGRGLSLTPGAAVGTAPWSWSHPLYPKSVTGCRLGVGTSDLLGKAAHSHCPQSDSPEKGLL